MKNMEGESDESTKTAGIEENSNVKFTPEKSRKSAKYKSSALLQDIDEEMHDELFDWPETPITKIK
jgi:hypothetical protein